MKIAVNGYIIDTENIYTIGEIKKNHYYAGNIWYHFFEIVSLNNKVIEIDIKFDNETLNNKHLLELSIMKIDRFRNSIIKVWSDNQSTIPQFNLDDNV